MNFHFPRTLAQLFLVGASMALVQASWAADIYITPDGAGSEEGTDWANARSQYQLQSAVNEIGPGDTVYVGSGTYAVSGLVIEGDGTADSPKTFSGVDTGDGLPTFEGSFDPASPSGGAFITLGKISHWTIRSFNIHKRRFGITAPVDGTNYDTHADLLIENVHVDTCEDAFRLYSAQNITVRHCSVIRYIKKGYRTADYCQFITYESCTADCNAGDDNFPAAGVANGFYGDDVGGAPILHDITYVDCISRNNRYKQSSGSYWNGDGYSTERGTYNVTYLRCQAYDNDDGGFDNKAETVTLQDCIAARNNRNFRQWGGGATMTNCVAFDPIKRGGSGDSADLWVSGNGGSITVSFCTFHARDDNKMISAESGSSTTVVDSIFSSDSAGNTFISGPVTLTRTVTKHAGESNFPAYKAYSNSWEGTPADAMDSTVYTDTKGYSSTRRSGRSPDYDRIFSDAYVYTGDYCYSKVLGWSYVTAFPYVYSFDTGTWVYVSAEASQADEVYLYDFASGKWFYTSQELYPWGWDLIQGDWASIQ